MNRFRRTLRRLDHYIGPIYHIAFLTSFVIGGVAVAWLYFNKAFTFVVSRFVPWFDRNIADIDLDITSPPRQVSVLGAIIVGLIAGMIFILSRISAVGRARIQIIEELQRCTQDHIKYYDDLYNILTDSTLEQSNAMRMISEISRAHLIFLCSRMAEVFELLTYGACHASIKTLNSEDKRITTRTRDALSVNGRRVTVDEHLRSFNYRDNTAFEMILDNPKCGFYLNNWLRISEKLGKYRNANDEWKKSYRATVVVPISVNRNPAEINAASVIGFICIDNRCGHFDRKYSRAILGIFTTLICDMMIKLGEIQAADAGGNNA